MIRTLKKLLKPTPTLEVPVTEQKVRGVTRQEIADLFAQDLGYTTRVV